MKNIHILPTDKPSRVFITNAKSIADNLEVKINIYITSDEEIKEEDWFIEPINKSVLKLKDNADKLINSIFPTCKKIILTTDQYLIKDGVQAIDDEFLEWFVKNPSCEEVEVELKPMFPMYKTFKEDINTPPFYGNLKYKIIIPKEEPKQETLEERKPYWDLIDKKAEQSNTVDLDAYANGVEDGVKWQQERMYSEKEVPNKLDSVLAKITHQNDLGLAQYYEVVYYDIDNGKWCSYSGSKTFEDGERVVEWKYCKEIF